MADPSAPPRDPNALAPNLAPNAVTSTPVTGNAGRTALENVYATYSHKMSENAIVQIKRADYFAGEPQTFLVTTKLNEKIKNSTELKADLATVGAFTSKDSEPVRYRPTTSLLNRLSYLYATVNELDYAIIFASTGSKQVEGSYLGIQYKPDYSIFVATLQHLIDVIDSGVATNQPWSCLIGVGEHKKSSDQPLPQLKSYMSLLKRYRPDLATVHGFQVSGRNVQLASLNACGMWVSEDTPAKQMEPWLAIVASFYHTQAAKHDAFLRYCAYQVDFHRWDVSSCGPMPFAVVPFHVGHAPGRVTFAAFELAPTSSSPEDMTRAFFEEKAKGFFKVSWQDTKARSTESALLQLLHKDGWLPGLVRPRYVQRLTKPISRPGNALQRVQEVIHLASIGEPLSQAISLRHLLYIFYDLLETHLHMCEKNVLHRDLSWFNILIFPRHTIHEGKSELKRPCISKIMHAANVHVGEEAAALGRRTDPDGGEDLFEPCALITDLDHSALIVDDKAGDTAGAKAGDTAGDTDGAKDGAKDGHEDGHAGGDEDGDKDGDKDCNKDDLKNGVKDGAKDAGKKGRFERTGTPMFIATELASRDPINHNDLNYPLELLVRRLEAVEKDAPDVFKVAFPNGDDGFMRKFRKIAQQETTRRTLTKVTRQGIDVSNPKPSHEPRHDCESAFWVMLWAFSRARPLVGDPEDETSKNIREFNVFCTAMLTHEINGAMGEVHRSRYLKSTNLEEPMFHPSFVELRGLFGDLATYLLIPWHLYATGDDAPKTGHVHVAFQRLILGCLFSSEPGIIGALDIPLHTQQPRITTAVKDMTLSSAYPVQLRSTTGNTQALAQTLESIHDKIQAAPGSLNQGQAASDSHEHGQGAAGPHDIAPPMLANLTVSQSKDVDLGVAVTTSNRAAVAEAVTAVEASASAAAPSSHFSQKRTPDDGHDETEAKKVKSSVRAKTPEVSSDEDDEPMVTVDEAQQNAATEPAKPWSVSSLRLKFWKDRLLWFGSGRR